MGDCAWKSNLSLAALLWQGEKGRVSRAHPALLHPDPAPTPFLTFFSSFLAGLPPRSDAGSVGKHQLSPGLTGVQGRGGRAGAHLGQRTGRRSPSGPGRGSQRPPFCGGSGTGRGPGKVHSGCWSSRLKSDCRGQGGSCSARVSRAAAGPHPPRLFARAPAPLPGPDGRTVGRARAVRGVGSRCSPAGPSLTGPRAGAPGALDAPGAPGSRRGVAAPARSAARRSRRRARSGGAASGKLLAGPERSRGVLAAPARAEGGGGRGDRGWGGGHAGDPRGGS